MTLRKTHLRRGKEGKDVSHTLEVPHARSSLEYGVLVVELTVGGTVLCVCVCVCVVLVWSACVV